MRPDDQNTLTFQYADMNDAPQGPAPRPRYKYLCIKTLLSLRKSTIECWVLLLDIK